MAQAHERTDSLSNEPGVILLWVFFSFLGVGSNGWSPSFKAWLILMVSRFSSRLRERSEANDRRWESYWKQQCGQQWTCPHPQYVESTKIDLQPKGVLGFIFRSLDTIFFVDCIRQWRVVVSWLDR